MIDRQIDRSDTFISFSEIRQHRNMAWDKWWSSKARSDLGSWSTSKNSTAGVSIEPMAQIQPSYSSALNLWSWFARSFWAAAIFLDVIATWSFACAQREFAKDCGDICETSSFDNDAGGRTWAVAWAQRSVPKARVSMPSKASTFFQSPLLTFRSSAKAVIQATSSTIGRSRSSLRFSSSSRSSGGGLALTRLMAHSTFAMSCVLASVQVISLTRWKIGWESRREPQGDFARPVAFLH